MDILSMNVQSPFELGFIIWYPDEILENISLYLSCCILLPFITPFLHTSTIFSYA